jgi:hypothetical protein
VLYVAESWQREAIIICALQDNKKNIKKIGASRSLEKIQTARIYGFRGAPRRICEYQAQGEEFRESHPGRRREERALRRRYHVCSLLGISLQKLRIDVRGERVRGCTDSSLLENLWLSWLWVGG